MPKTIHWGIIGPGKIARKFADDLKLLPHARLHAVASRSEERARAFARDYGTPHAYGSYEALLDCPDLDVVYVATPHVQHYENTLACLRRGIAVLCEKPFAMNARQVEEMVAVAREQGVFLMEALWTRFMPTILKAQELIREGELGDVLSVKADFGFRGPGDPQGRLLNPELGGGALLDIGIYPVFLALLVLGRPRLIRALSHLGSTGVDEETGMLFHYAGGAMAHLHCSIRTNTKTEAFIYGDRGVLNIHTRWHEASWMTLIKPNERPQEFRFEYMGRGYYLEAEHVMQCLNDGKTESDWLPLDFSLDLIRLLDAVREQTGIQYPTVAE